MTYILSLSPCPAFLRLFNLRFRVPILALVDCDPYGIDILSVYKYGSISMSHEQDSLVAPRIAWAGVRSEDIAEYVRSYFTDTMNDAVVFNRLDIDRSTLIPITKHDQKKVRHVRYDVLCILKMR